MKKALILLLSLTFSLPALAADKAATKPVCLPAAKLTNQMAPPELYASYEQCLKQDKKEEAGYIFFVAASYGMYDTYRVPDKTTHEAAREIIKKISEKQSQPEQLAMGLVLKDQMSAPVRMYPICKVLLDLGPPMYAPTYMAGETGTVLTMDEFDAGAAWLTSLGLVTKCPVKTLQLDAKTFKP